MTFAGNEVLVRCLLDHQADVNVRDKSNATPLLKAKAEDNVHIVKILEKHFCRLYKIDCSDSEEGEEVGGAENITGFVDPAAAAAAIIMGWAPNTSNVSNPVAAGANERHSTSSNGSSNNSKREQNVNKKKKKKKTTANKEKKKGKKNDEADKKKKKKKGSKGKAAADDQSGGVATTARTKEEELLALDETKLCKICFERPMDTVLLGCGHVAVCLFCSQYLQLCPMCSAPIEKVSKIYFS